jgi:triacylglycerol esterase/lipase EstA (alpha/beta hydrolase family)
LGRYCSFRATAVRLAPSGRQPAWCRPDGDRRGLPGDGTGDLDQQAAALARAVRAARSQTGSATVDIVGYSAGGVVARLWARDHGGAAVARRIVTLGSPQHGTDLASVAGSLAPGGCPVACQQLATDSPLLDRLNTGDETPTGPTFVSIWTADDQTVVPPDSARLGAEPERAKRLCIGPGKSR